MMKRRNVRFATKTGGALTALLLSLSGVSAQSVAAPKSDQIRDVTSAPAGASACLGCHGARETELPSLAKLSASDIEAAMAQFRSGAREATLMNRIAKGFTPEESKAIAAWLSETVQ